MTVLVFISNIEWYSASFFKNFTTIYFRQTKKKKKKTIKGYKAKKIGSTHKNNKGMINTIMALLQFYSLAMDAPLGDNSYR